MSQRHSTALLALVSLVLTACSPMAEAQSLPTTPPPTSSLPAAASSATAPATSTAVSVDAPTANTREALLSELVNDVRARPSAQSDLQPVREGDRVSAGGLVRTGVESKARLDLTEGTIVRLGPDSEFTIETLSADPTDPFTRLTLLGGKVWVILFGGELEVETPVGVATVRGSYLSVHFDAAKNTLVATCLEGRCTLRNEQGSFSLTNGQWSQITGPSDRPSPPQPMTLAQVQEWTQNNPEADRILAEAFPRGTPTPGAPPPGSPGGGGSGPISVSPVPPPAGTPNSGPLRYSISNNCPASMGSATITFAGPETETVTVATGETRSGELPPGMYTITLRFDAGGADDSIVYDSSFGPINRGTCDSGPPGGATGQPPPNGTLVSTQPLHYSLTHNCPVDSQTGLVREGTWEWTFENLTTGQTYSVSVQPGEHKEGDLPPGHYRVSDRDATGSLESGEMDSGGPGISVSRCQEP